MKDRRGDREGGTFTSGGWRVDNNSDFLRYEVPSIQNGYVQWQNLGLTPQGIADSRMFFGMWDPTAGNFRTNPFRVNLQHNWPPTTIRPDPTPLDLPGPSGRRGLQLTDWDPARSIPGASNGAPDGEDELARVLPDGVEVIRLPYNHGYLPNTHRIELGIEERKESIIGSSTGTSRESAASGSCESVLIDDQFLDSADRR
jgi:hypothetical protein